MSKKDSQSRLLEMDTPDMHEAMLRGQWKDFAAFAYENYKVGGRGAIIVDLKNTEFQGDDFTIPTWYVAEGSKDLEELGGWANDEIAQAVADYDPELDAVILVHRVDGDYFHYLATDQLTPRRAYEQRRRK